MKNVLSLIIISIIFTSGLLLSQTATGCNSSGCHMELLNFKFVHPAAEDDCLSCHDILNKSHPSKEANDVALLDESPSLCYTCHDDKEPVEESKSVHPPFEEDCLNCHSPHASNNQFMTIEAVPELCFACHDDPKGIENIKSFHGAIEVGKKCINCHTPHQSQQEYLLKGETTKLCLGCHNKKIEYGDEVIQNIAEKFSKEDQAHPPVVVDGCTACHSPHSSQYPYLLLNSFPEETYASGEKGNYNLCFTCHDESTFTKPITTSDTEFRNGNINLHYVHVNRDKSRSCTNCHDVHGSKNKHLILGEVAFGKWEMKLNYKVSETGGSCLPGCHKEQIYDRTIAN